MSQRDELYAALQKADAAGDTAGAKQLADYIRTMPAEPTQTPMQPAYEPKAIDRVSNVGTGFNSGVASLAGLPVDTALNVWDLLKAGAGGIQGLVTGKTPSSVFDPADRSQYIGSSEQLKNLMNKSEVTDTRAIHPEDTANRYLHVAGSALPAAMTAQPSTLGQTAAAVTQNVLPAVVAQKTAEVTQGTPYENTAPILASLLTQAAPSAVSATTKALTPKPDQATADAANLLENSGVQLDASQKTGGLKTLKKLVQDSPFTSGAEAEKGQTQKQQFTSAVLKLMGEDAPAATPDVMNRAQRRIGGTIDDISARTPIKYDPELHSSISNVMDEAAGALSPTDLATLTKQVARMQPKDTRPKYGTMLETVEPEAIPGNNVQGARSTLGVIANGGGTVGHYAGELRKVIDDAIQKNAQGADYDKLAEARQQYRILKQIEPVIDKQGDGMISPARLPTSMSKGAAGKSQMIYGRGDQRLVDLAKAGSKLLPDRSPNSGTPARAMIQMLPTALAQAGSSLFMGGNPIPALTIGAGTIGAPKLGQYLLNNPDLLMGNQVLSPQRNLQYLTTQATQMTPEERRKLIAEGLQ